MRCLNKLYTHPGDCNVCHMDLKPYAESKRKLLGYHCPLHRSAKVFDKSGNCPFCGLQLKELYDGPPPPRIESDLQLWPLVDGKTAVYLRPFEVRKIGVESYVRAAGRLQGRRLSLRLDAAQRRGLKVGSSAMTMPAQGYARQVLATVTALGPGDVVTLQLVRPIPDVTWALAELRVASAPTLAVPLAALVESDGQARVFVRRDESYEPRAVTVTARGESYASVQGLSEGETVAGAGVFWLEAQWRMEHP